MTLLLAVIQDYQIVTSEIFTALIEMYQTVIFNQSCHGEVPGEVLNCDF